MKKFHLSIYALVLALLFSACANTTTSALFSKKEILLDESLPKIEELKTLASINSIGFEWGVLYDENIAGFYLYRSSMKEPEMKLVATIKNKYQTHYVDTRLEPNTVYTYTMKSFNNQGHISLDGVKVEVKTEDRLIAVPFVQAISGLPRKNKLVWRPHPDLRVASYLIQRANLESENFRTIAEVQNRLSAEYIDEDLKSDSGFKYLILAKTFDNILSYPSQILSSTTKALPPGIEHLSASVDIASKIILTWDNIPYEDFAYYKIYRTSSSLLPFTLLAKSTENRYEDIINETDKTRYYKITIVDKDGLESPMPKEAVMGKTLAAPQAPVIVGVVATEDGIELEWLSNDNRAVYYNLIRYGQNEAIFKEITETKFKDITAQSGQSYTYEVIAVDKDGIESKPSGRVKVGN